MESKEADNKEDVLKKIIDDATKDHGNEPQATNAPVQRENANPEVRLELPFEGEDLTPLVNY